MARKQKNKAKRAKNKRIILFAGVILIAIILSVGISFFSQTSGVLEVQTAKMDVVVAEKLGFNLDTDALHFGSVAAGGRSSRELIIKNMKDFPMRIKIYETGQLADWVYAEQSSFIIGPLEIKKAKMTVEVPKDAELGYYEGNVSVVFKKA